MPPVPPRAPRRQAAPRRPSRPQQQPPPLPIRIRIRPFPLAHNPEAITVMFAPCINGTLTVGKRVIFSGEEYAVTALADDGTYRAIAHLKRYGEIYINGI